MSSITNVTAVNLGVLCGPCSAPPELRVLESGTRLATLAIRCPAGPAGDERATSVPVTVWDPPAWIDTAGGRGGRSSSSGACAGASTSGRAAWARGSTSRPSWSVGRVTVAGSTPRSARRSEALGGAGVTPGATRARGGARIPGPAGALGTTRSAPTTIPPT